jgi:hypothetical protein
MAHRDTDTLKWDDSWYQGLSMQSKLLWMYICDKCDQAGVWKENRPLAEFQIGSRIDWEEAAKDFSGRIDTVEDRWVVLGFIRFHYGELHEGHKMFGKVQSVLSSHKMTYSTDSLSIVYNFNGNRLSATLDSLKDKDKDKDKDSESHKKEETKKENVSNKEPAGFLLFWAAYPKKVGKGAAVKAWWVHVKPSRVETDTILGAIEWQKKSDQWTKENGQFIPHPATWLNQHRWEDQPVEPIKTMAQKRAERPKIW